jgi:nitrogen regulatory protein P-II 1
MKNLTLVVHADLRQSLADVLRNLKQVSGFTFTPVQGHGPQDEHDPALSAHDRVVGYTPHVRVDIVLHDMDVDSVLASLRDADGGISGRGVYWVTAAEKYGPL